jgi:peptide/nickel transport system substrate-binding protein
MDIRRPLIPVLLLVLALLASACGTADEPLTAEPTPEDGAAVTDETAEDPTPLETEDDEVAAAGDAVDVLRLSGGNFGYPTPFAYVRGPGMIATSYIFDTLLWPDATGEPISWLATDWEESDDGTEWRFTIRDGVTFHDGEPLTVDDIVFTYRYMTEGAAQGVTSPLSPALEVLEDVTGEGDEIVFHLDRPYAPFAENVAARLFILPEHIWADVDDPVQFRGDESVIGSGPYRLEDIDEASGSYLYVAHEDHFLGPPLVRRLEFVPAPDELLALQRGEVDAAEVGLEEAIPEEQLASFDADDRFESIESEGDWNLALHFNLDEGFPYDDVRFRHAVAYAIDRQDLVDRIMFGRGEIGSAGALAPAHPMLTDDLPDYAHDTERAEELLDELGMVDADGDGFRDLPDGSAFAPQLLASNRFSPQTPQLIAEHLREVGIQIELDLREGGASDEAGVEGAYTLALHGYGGIMSDPDFLRTRFSSRVPARAFWRAHGYENEQFDDLAQEQLSTVDPDQRRALLGEMQGLLAEDLPVLSLYVPNRVLYYDSETFDAWYYTPGCSPCRGSRNKHMHVTGLETGLPEDAQP